MSEGAFRNTASWDPGTRCKANMTPAGSDRDRQPNDVEGASDGYFGHLLEC
jgi:hypothetical protein